MTEKSDINDLQFLNQLAIFYRIVNVEEKAAQVDQTIQNLTVHKTIDIFKR